MTGQQVISYWNREKQRLESEKIYGDRAIRLVYETALGRWLARHLISRPWISRIYGAFQSSFLSKFKIQPFIRKFQIQMDEYEDRDFPTFNEFFIRRFKPGMRSFVETDEEMPAFAEGRYLGYSSVSLSEVYPVKGEFLTARAILGDDERTEIFEGGPMLIARLCPVDYHRFHFPDDGWYIESYRMGGPLHSVNPIALKSKPDIFSTNERRVSILQSQNFGCLAYVEVGATNVGLIVQTHPPDQNFKRGDEKGYFYFGASTVILMGEPGKWSPAEDLLEKTQKQTETFIKLGTKIAQSL